jgi:hypothetical protein
MADTHMEAPMLLVRYVFHCKPGKVRPMVEMFLAMAKFPTASGVGKMRVMTDFAGRLENGTAYASRTAAGNTNHSCQQRD